MAHRGHQEGQARRRGGRVLHHGQTLELRFGQVLQALRRGQSLLLEVAFVIVQADVAKVHRHQTVLGVQLQRVRDVLQALRLVGLKDVGLDGPAEEGVVHPEEDVGQGVLLAEDGFVQRRASVPRLEELDLGVVGLLENGNHLLADLKAVVRHDGQGTWPGRGWCLDRGWCLGRSRRFGRGWRLSHPATAGCQRHERCQQQQQSEHTDS